MPRGIGGHYFKPGQSGNPGGRPKVRSLSKAYRNQLEQPNPADPAQRSFAECIAEKLVQMAAKGNVQACIELADRCEGKVKLAIGAVEDDEFFDDVGRGVGGGA